MQSTGGILSHHAARMTRKRKCCCQYILWLRAQVEAFKSAGFLHRKSLQYHWRNRDRTTDSSTTINNNNGAGVATATDSTVVLGATPITPSEEAQRVVNAAREGDDGSSTKYVDFDSYLGNFASKRRIKVGVFFFLVFFFLWRRGEFGGPLLLSGVLRAARVPSLWGCFRQE